MKIWLVRAGSSGEYEQKFLDESRVYLTWDGLSKNLLQISDRNELMSLLEETYPEAKARRLANYASQIWPFAKVMAAGDWVVLPSKKQPVIHIGKITSDYMNNPEGPDPYFHWRTVEWFALDIPRSNFSQDLLYSFGAFMTICRIQRNNAVERIQAMEKNNWQPESGKSIIKQKVDNLQDDASDEAGAEIDLEYTAMEQVVRLIEAKFKGHNLTKLVSAVLEAKGYTVWQSPEGADGGADILASNGQMGFGEQTICVEVKSGTGTTDRETVDKLLGAMSKFNAKQGLFVAWGGFKQNVQKELASSFFRLRLWTQNDFLEQLFSVYEKLDDEIKAELPLKRIWTVTLQD
jgi:restriction system protein